MRNDPVPFGPRLDIARLTAEWKELQKERKTDEDLDFALRIKEISTEEQDQKYLQRISLLHTWLHKYYLPLRTPDDFNAYISERDLLHKKPADHLITEVDSLFDPSEVEALPRRVHQDPVHFLALVDALLTPYEKFAREIATVAGAKRYVRERYAEQQSELWGRMDTQQRASAMAGVIQTPAVEIEDEDCEQQTVRRTKELTLSENPLLSALSVLHSFSRTNTHNHTLAGAPLLLAAARVFLSRHSSPR